MAFLHIPHFTPITFIFFLLLFSSSSNLPILALNITHLLSPYPDLSDFAALLLSTAVADDLSPRSSLTLLAVPNSFLRSPASDDLLSHHPPSSLADVIRYHVLLQYLSPASLAAVSPAGKLVTTLYQTTGRAISNFGSVNITRDPVTNSVAVRSPAAYSSSNATIITLIENLPYNVSIFSINSLLVPYGYDLMTSDSRPPLGVNITKALIDGHNFNVAAAMLAASGVVEEFEADEGGAGITLFVPTDEAFSDLPPNANFQSLPAEKKAAVLKFHVLHSYYPLGSLQSIVNPVQPTLATEKMGAGSFTLNISRVNGSVAINTGIIQASVTQTVLDQNPVAIFGVSRVLLPKEIFGNNPIEMGKEKGGFMDGAESPEVSPAPESVYGPGSNLSAPPGFREEVLSDSGKNGVQRILNLLVVLCILLYLIV